MLNFPYHYLVPSRLLVSYKFTSFKNGCAFFTDTKESCCMRYDLMLSREGVLSVGCTKNTESFLSDAELARRHE